MNPQDPQTPTPVPAEVPETPQTPPQPSVPPTVSGAELPKTVIEPTQAPPAAADPTADLPVAAHMEGPPPQTAAPSTPANPDAAFAAAPQTMATPPVDPTQAAANPALPPASPIMTQSDMLAATQPKRNRKKPLIIGGGVLAVALVAVVALAFMNVISVPFIGGNLKTVTYDNGEGNTYKLKFLKDHTIETDDNMAFSTSSSQKYLKSKPFGDNKYGLVVGVASEEVGSEDEQEVEQLKTCSGDGYGVALEVDTKKLGKVTLCNITFLGDDYKDLVYIGVFEHEGKFHAVAVAPDVDSSSVATAEEAKKLAEEASLKKYESEIKKIVASINPQ